MSIQQSAIRAATWSVVQSWGDQAFGFVVFIALARILAPEHFGLIAYSTALIGFMQVFVRGGMGMAVVQREALEPEHLDTAFWYSVCVGLVLATALAVGAAPISRVLGEARLEPILRWLSPLFVLNALAETQVAILRRELRFRPLALRTVASNALGGIAGVLAAFSGLGVWSLVIQQLVAMSSGVAILWGSTSWRPRIRFSTSHFRELFAFGGHVTLTSLLWAITDRIDRILIGRFLGTVPLGAYAVGARGLNMIVNLVGKTIAGVGLPVFSRLQAEPERMRRGYYTALRLNCMATFPAYCGLVALAPELVPALFGPGWEQAIPVMQLLSLFGISQAFQAFAVPVMNSMGKPSWVTTIAFANATLTTAGVIAAIPFGVVAVAGAIAIRGTVMIPFMLGGVHRLIRLQGRDLASAFVVPLLASVVVGVLAHLASVALAARIEPVFVRLPLVAVGGAVVYVGLIRLFAPALYGEALRVLEQAVPARLRARLFGAPK